MAIPDRTQQGQPIPPAPAMPTAYPALPEKLLRAFPEAEQFFRRQEDLYKRTREAITTVQQDLAVPAHLASIRTSRLGNDGIYVGTIEADQVIAVNLSAISAEIGTLKIGTNGSISQGQTAYDTGTGFWLGDVNGVQKFSLGNSAGNKLTWDGTNLDIVAKNLGLGDWTLSSYWSAGLLRTTTSITAAGYADNIPVSLFANPPLSLNSYVGFKGSGNQETGGYLTLIGRTYQSSVMNWKQFNTSISHGDYTVTKHTQAGAIGTYGFGFDNGWEFTVDSAVYLRMAQEGIRATEISIQPSAATNRSTVFKCVKVIAGQVTYTSGTVQMMEVSITGMGWANSANIVIIPTWRCAGNTATVNCSPAFIPGGTQKLRATWTKPGGVAFAGEVIDYQFIVAEIT